MYELPNIEQHSTMQCMASEVAKQCADKIYESMRDLDPTNFPWLHNPHTFLPQNVIIDKTGEQQFKTFLADTIQRAMDEHRMNTIKRRIPN